MIIFLYHFLFIGGIALNAGAFVNALNVSSVTKRRRRWNHQKGKMKE